MAELNRTALVVVDVQQAFDDDAYWGRRNNPDCEANVGRLIAAWRAAERPIVFVRHEFETHPHDFKDVVTGEPDLLVSKTVNSAFYGSPDLDAWLRENGIGAIDATHTFDRTGPDGTVMTADELARATATSLHEEFAAIVRTDQLVT